MEEWSSPDQHGIRTLEKDIGVKSTLRGRRLRRADNPDPKPVQLWPEPLRDLLRKWVRGTSSRRQWKTLIKEAGQHEIHAAFELLNALLEAGWVEIEESRSRGKWDAVAVEILKMEELRGLLGLPNRVQLQESFIGLSGEFLSEEIRQAFSSLANISPNKALKRHELLLALDTWIEEQRSGTRRDFALFARGDTKDISSSEWSWLAGVLDIEKHGISQHTPALWFLAPITLIFPEGEMDLLPIRSILALPPASIMSVLQVKGNLSCWRVIENRTSFERVAKHVRPGEGILWVPGFAPSWWVNAAAHLVSLCPAPLYIACDPDPAGVMIAAIVSRVWIDNALPWQPWGMSPEIAEKIPHKKPLSENDKKQAEDLLANTSISFELKRLLLWMQESGMKVEQEGIQFENLVDPGGSHVS